MLQMCYNQNATLIQGNPLRLGCEKELRIKKGLPIFPGIFLLSWRGRVEVRSGFEPL